MEVQQLGNLALHLGHKVVTEIGITYADHYFHRDSHHNLSAKYSVFNTLIHRARTVCATPNY